MNSPSLIHIQIHIQILKKLPLFICVDFIVEDTILAKEKQNESFQKISINEQGIWIPLCYATFYICAFHHFFLFPSCYFASTVVLFCI